MILGTGGSWFLLDYAFYGNSISTPLILKTVAPHASLIQATAWSLMIFAIAAAPAYVTALAAWDGPPSLAAVVAVVWTGVARRASAKRRTW